MSGRTKLFLILPLLIFVIGFTSNAYGQVVNPITVSIDKASYSEGETIIVTGEVSEILFGYAISLTVIAPNGDVILIDQLDVDRYKKFQTEIAAGGSLYDEAGYGTYTVSVLYATANRTASTSFQYIGSGTTQPSITISTDKSVYFYGNYIEISGEINPFNNHQGVTMFVLSSEGKEVVSGITGKIYPYDKSYHFTIRAIGPHWENFGEYKIHVGWLGSSETVSIQFLAKPGPSPQCGSNEKLVGDRCVPLDVTPPEGSQIIDNDNDGVPDSKDKCLIHREDYNGYLDDDGCPDIPRKKAPFEKELLNGDEYVPIVYSIDFTKRPLIGISFGENRHELFQKVIPSIKNGVEMWTTPLEQKYGGDWGVDFVIITPQNQLQVKPDIIFNIETLESNEKCSGYSAWAHQPKEYDSIKKIWKAKIPLNIHDCFKLEYLEEPKYFELLSTTSFESTAAHEFFHSLGFDHICNKELDLMTGPSCTQQKPGGYTYEEFKKRKIVSDFDLTAIAYLYGVDGFQNPNKPVFSNSKFTANDYLNFDASTYTITPVSSPKPEMEKAMEPKILRPLQQVALGISQQDVTCKDDFHKLYKSSGIPICVFKSTAEKLIARGFIR